MCLPSICLAELSELENCELAPTSPFAHCSMGFAEAPARPEDGLDAGAACFSEAGPGTARADSNAWIEAPLPLFLAPSGLLENEGLGRDDGDGKEGLGSEDGLGGCGGCMAPRLSARARPSGACLPKIKQYGVGVSR